MTDQEKIIRNLKIATFNISVCIVLITGLILHKVLG